MRHTSVWPSFYLPLLLALALPAMGSEPEWVEVRSPHFSVVTDAGEKRGRDAALHFEQMRAVFGALLVKSKVSLPTPLQIVAFRNTKEMRQFAPLWRGKPTQVAGLFEGNTDRTFILLDMSADEPWQVVFHEYAHQLMNGNIPTPSQPWFEEGFAEYFSTIRVTGKDAEVGRVSDTDVQILRQAGMMKIADLFRVRHDSSTYNESGDHRSVFYAESWLVVHYLYDQHLVAKAGDYFEASDQPGVSVEQAIQRGFGMSATDFDKVIRQYWEGGQTKFYRLPTPAGIESTGYTVKPLGVADAKAVLADAHLHSPDYQEKAMTEFEEALKLQADNTAALRGLGYGYLMKKDYHRAGEYFTQAADHDSNDPRVLYYAGLLAEMEEGPTMGSDPTRVASIQQKLQKSVTLDPDFADAYSLLAFTYMAQRNFAQAQNAMRKALVLSPRNEEYALNLAQMYLASQNLDSAVAILQHLKGSSNPAVAARAARSLEQVEEFKQVSQLVRVAPGVPSSEPTGAEMATDEHPAITEPEPDSPKELSAVRFLKGKLLAVDCSAPPNAMLTILGGAKTWKLRVKDSGHVIVIGADKFSCEWKNQSVAVNYRATANADGEVVSVEVQ